MSDGTNHSGWVSKERNNIKIILASENSTAKRRKRDKYSTIAEIKEDPNVEVEVEVEARDVLAKAYCIQNPELADMKKEEETHVSKPAVEIQVYMESTQVPPPPEPLGSVSSMIRLLFSHRLTELPPSELQYHNSKFALSGSLLV